LNCLPLICPSLIGAIEPNMRFSNILLRWPSYRRGQDCQFGRTEPRASGRRAAGERRASGGRAAMISKYGRGNRECQEVEKIDELQAAT